MNRDIDELMRTVKEARELLGQLQVKSMPMAMKKKHVMERLVKSLDVVKSLYDRPMLPADPRYIYWPEGCEDNAVELPEFFRESGESSYLTKALKAVDLGQVWVFGYEVENDNPDEYKEWIIKEFTRRSEAFAFAARYDRGEL